MLHKFVALIFCIGIFFLWRYVENRSDREFHSKEIMQSERLWTWHLINPLLECELNTYGWNQKYIPFEDDVRDRIQDEVIAKNKDLHISLYFRNLRNGPWFGIDENANFAPASLMKLPVTLAYAKWWESYPALWNITFTGSVDPTIQDIAPEKRIEPWKPYTIDTLIRYALIYSDNNANRTLLDHIPRDILFRVFRDLSIPVIDEIEKWENEYISVKEYASFFRILYNASYLSQDHSSYLLDIMTQSAMTGAIRGSIPSDISVAHKFGERRLPQGESDTYVSQFHDCGIIYYEKYPYILCIMTKGGDDIPRLAWVVEDISQIIFTEIQDRYK
jgi:beta-lactamase class A